MVIENLDDVEISDIEIHVWGNSYNIKKIDPGKSASIRIEVTAESDVKLKINNQIYIIDIYLEPNFSGTVRAGIKKDGVIYGYYET